MSKMLCTCGHVIRDGVYPSATEALVLRQPDRVPAERRIQKAIAGFIAAIAKGERQGWLHAHFSPSYPTDISDAEAVLDIVSNGIPALSMAECAQCGRLWVQQAPGTNAYRSYAPDLPGYAQALASLSDP